MNEEREASENENWPDTSENENMEVEDKLSNLAFMSDYNVFVSDFEKTIDGVEGDGMQLVTYFVD